MRPAASEEGGSSGCRSAHPRLSTERINNALVKKDNFCKVEHWELFSPQSFRFQDQSDFRKIAHFSQICFSKDNNALRQAANLSLLEEQ